MEEDEDQPKKKGKVTRQTELSRRQTIVDKCLKLYQDVLKGYTDQNSRADTTLDHWDAYKLKLSDKQFYSGNSKIYLPLIHDAVDARKTRFANQLFPQGGRYVEVIAANGEMPHATMSLLDHYVQWNRLKTRIVRPMLANGDLEGQYSLYVSWRKIERFAGRKVKAMVDVDGVEDDTLDPVDDFEEQTVVEEGPWAEIIPDSDLLVLPQTADTIEDALEAGGSVTILRRWSKAAIKRMIADGEFVESQAENLLSEMNAVINGQQKQDTAKEIANAAGIKAKGKYALGYETWTKLKIDGQMRICRVYFGGDNIVLGVKLNPYWCDKVPVISGSVEKDAGVFKGRAPVADVLDLQIFANDTINEGADTAHFSAMPIIMTDPEKNPRVNSLVLGLAAVWETSPNDTQFAKFPELWRDALERVGTVKAQIFQTLGVNPAMMTQQQGGKKLTQAEIANEQQVDLLMTADAVSVVEAEILSPLLERFAEYDAQFRDDTIVVRSFGELGEQVVMEEVEPQQMGNRYDFRWFGVEAARNAAKMQQQIAGINVIKGIPPQMYPGYKLNLAPMIEQMTEGMFGPRLAPLIFQKMDAPSVDPKIENDMLQHGFEVIVHPSDDDQKHMQAHMELMQTAGDPHGTIRPHIAAHQQQMAQKAQAHQQMMAGPQGGPPGANAGGGRPPVPGAQPGAPSGVKGPAGMIHPDSMAAAGAPMMPRKG